MIYLKFNQLLIGALLFIGSGLPFALKAQEHNMLQITGSISDDQKNGPLAGASIQIPNTGEGTTTDQQGQFSLRTRARIPFTLLITSVGYEPRKVEVKGTGSSLTIALATRTVLGNEVVVTASRVAESILKSPVAIEKLDIRAIKESAAPGFYDALENVKGVQMTTSSLTFKVPNTRGFNIPNNFRFMQLVDGVDMQAATLGVPLGNAIGPTELDIQSVEITPGAASALYGMNAINGMANLITKNPFTSQGLSFYQKIGVNHVDGKDHAPALLTETALRYARAFNDRFAFKLNIDYMQGTDWRSNTRLDQNSNNLKSANPGFPALNGTANAAFDGWNKYGDDALAGSNLVSIGGLTIDGKASQTLRVARTGYWETGLVSPRVKNIKFDGSLHYKPTANSEIAYTYRAGSMDGVFQRGNKIRLQGVIVHNHALQFKNKNFSWLSYLSVENTGNSYNVKPLADNMDLYSGGATDTKTVASWGTKYKNALNAYGTEHGGLSSANLAEATAYARQQADAGRALPGTARFDSIKNVITSINNWDIKSGSIPDAPVTGGAALVQKSKLYHTEAQWDLSPKVKVVNLLVGADARIYAVVPDGNNFVDFSRPLDERNNPLPDGSFGKNVLYKKFGGFAQATKTLFDERLKLFGSLRYDYNPEFTPKMTPRVAAVYTANEQHNFRVTYQQGYRFPALFEALSFVNNGRVKRVGSLSYINDGLGYLDNSYTQQSVVNFNAAASAQGNTDAAALASRDLLIPARLPKARPEKINSLEIGYKSILFDNKVVIDIDAYSNVYDGFLGQVQVFVPKGETIGSDAAVLAMLDRNRDATSATATTATSKGQDRYRVYTNAKNKYTNYGSSLGITYNFYQNFLVKTNVAYNKMKTNKTNDIFVTGFNTPNWTSNITFGNREIFKNFGFNVTWRWQNAFLWESPLVTGTISAYHTVDAQVNLRLPALKTTIKAGASDLLNHRYLQYAGGPTIGGLYYLTLTLDNILQ
ncbi:TonB-dependent receptor [Niabella hirudinis]|uniref:TonB-dependent receptor n=1 Tax=Niabella hirudinis TaxID=1285929 RepID=UPI003EBA955E